MKTISLNSSRMKSVTVERDGDLAIITVVGVGSDGSDEYPALNLVMDWDELPQQMQNTADNFCKHMSREYNKFIALEDSETW